jgi:hypothetical protein
MFSQHPYHEGLGVGVGENVNETDSFHIDERDLVQVTLPEDDEVERERPVPSVPGDAELKHTPLGQGDRTPTVGGYPSVLS